MTLLRLIRPYVNKPFKKVFYLSGLIAFFTSGAAISTTGENKQQCLEMGSWFAPQSGASNHLETSDFMSSMAGRQVVLLGERHDSFEHHRWQLQTIAALHGRRPDMVLGFEMFPRRVQKTLDRWVAGDLSEAEFLEQSDWNRVWSYDPELYLPIFHFARMNRIPMMALNVERSLTSAVRDKGWENVPKELREGISEPAPASKDYLETLFLVFQMHSHTGSHLPANSDSDSKLDDPAFRRFVASQLVWDRAMAEAIAEAADQPGKAPLVVGIMGSGHIMSGFGVPHQLVDLGIEDSAVLLPWERSMGCHELQSGLADAVFGIHSLEEPKQDKPRLGVLLGATGNGVQIVEVVEGSVAEAADLREQDLITGIAGLEVEGVGAVMEAIQRQAPGTWLPIRIKRGDKHLERIAKFPP